MFLAKSASSTNQLFSFDIFALIWENLPFEKVTSKRLAKTLAVYTLYPGQWKVCSCILENASIQIEMEGFSILFK